MKKTTTVSLIVLSFLLIVGCNYYGKEKNFNNLKLYYTSDITEEEANSLGEYLLKLKLAENEHRSFQIAKTGNTYEFRAPVKKGIEQDEEYGKKFKLIAKDLSVNVFNGSEVDFHACDDNLKTLRVFPMSSN
jgi:hypothetical protein